MTTIIGTGEVGALHSREELEEMQRLPLQRKIQITTARIIEWYQHYDGKVYVAFSGGKDSTVLLDIVRRIYPDVPAVFSDTGLEFPEVREFVKSCENVTIVRPEMNFRKVIEVYGYPVVSKRVANTVEYGHMNPLLCYPDEGAAKRYSELLPMEYVFCIKHRDWRTGKIERLELTEPEKVNGRNILIVDDICSRGGTFTHTAKALKEAGAEEVMLYVTHCENTILKGTVLTDGLISRVFATDSILRIDHEKISICR